ncbi:unnamed protein product [Meloidogyne enterolobii]|uniref:Uncharacterized protein n=2 Tax=Meloidogyne enterolobii TaxID=390850 RepID=A0ACB0Y8P3_MELEN|nr:unnamed protein product [Meloidogyne enterolobii]
MFIKYFVVFILLNWNILGSRADWWDDVVDGVHGKLTQAADWIKDKAGPTIREKFDETKKTLQDPKTHEKVQDWVEDEAVPVVKEKFEQFKNFVNDDVMPEVQKVVEAGAEANKRRNSRVEDDD